MKYDYFPAVGEGLYTETLQNGLAVFVIPKKGYHKATAHFAVNYGGSDMSFAVGGRRESTPAGVAHFLEHKLFDTKNGNALNLLAQNGASPNAYTNSGMTAYHFECTERFFEDLEILLSFVTEPYFTPESVAKEQGIIGQEIGMYDDDPDDVCYMSLMGALFSENPVRVHVGGSVESISHITAETLYLCHGSFYVPSNMALTVVGDVEPEKVAECARRHTAGKSGAVPERIYGEEKGGKPEKTRSERAMAVSIPQFFIGSAIKMPEGAAEKQRTRMCAQLAAALLLGSSGELYGELYEKGLINRSFAQAADFFPGGGALLCCGESERPDAVFDAIREKTRKMTDSGVEKDFSRVKKAVTGEHIFSLNSFDDICYNQASEYFSGARTLDRFAALASITPDEVTEFMRRSMDPENMAVSIISPAKG